MNNYLLEETIRPCLETELFERVNQKYVAVLTSQEWEKDCNRFDMGIELDIDVNEIHNTKAEVNYDSLTGTFQIPDRLNLQENEFCLPLP